MRSTEKDGNNRSVGDETINREYIGDLLSADKGYIGILGGRRGQYQILGPLDADGAD